MMADQLAPLQGRVAAILNARELVINIGSLLGVKHGDKFAVLADAPLQILDPTTGKLLDTVDREKVRVQASQVRDTITICRTYRMKGGISDIFGTTEFMRSLSAGASPETLRITDSSTPPPLSEQESYVKTNDRVIAVSD
jgi:hypothetical protein